MMEFGNLLQKRARGHLKVYLGMAPGVGKTYRMLTEAHQLLAKGVDVQAGVVVTHGRLETRTLLNGIPQIPPRVVYYRGKAIEELDLEEVLRRKPLVVLVDELAHTNAPGSQHEKRWQDVEALLDAGISVITAVNIQHVDTLSDEVSRIVQAPVQERVPFQFVEQADQLVHVDLSTEELLQRIQEGKVYEAGRAEQAFGHFFQEDNLLQLRRLALQLAAQVVSRRINLLLPTAQRVGPQRIAVSISTNEQTGKWLLRRTAQLASLNGAEWQAVYVQTRSEDPNTIALARRRSLLNLFKLAAEMGGKVQTLPGQNIAQTLLAHIEKEQISLLVLGQTRRTRWQLFWRGDLVRQLTSSDHTHPFDLLILAKP